MCKGGTHFKVFLRSKKLKGKTRIDKQRLIYKLLELELKERVQLISRYWGITQFKSFSTRALSVFGLAFPLEAFMACPTNQLLSFGFSLAFVT